MKDKRTDMNYTTGQAARICGCSQQTIIRCFDKGDIEGYRIPGSKFRRIPSKNLYRYMQENDMPLDRFSEEGVVMGDKKTKDYTTGQAARICGCSLLTIIRCFDKGYIEGYRIPGSKFRRIPSKNLYTYMQEHNMPLDRFPEEDIPKIKQEISTEQKGPKDEEDIPESLDFVI
jgi:excisionase family DNA binding protein